MIEQKIKEASTQALISYIAVYRALKINKSLAVQCMIELDKRIDSGDIVELEAIDAIADLLKSVGKGFVAKIAINDQIPDIINQLKEIGIIGIKISDNIIHVGKINQDKISEIKKISGVLEIESDKGILENVAGTKIS